MWLLDVVGGFYWVLLSQLWWGLSRSKQSWDCGDHNSATGEEMQKDDDKILKKIDQVTSFATCQSMLGILGPFEGEKK